MSFVPGPYSLTLHVLATLLIREFEWGIAVFIGGFSVRSLFSIPSA